MVLFYKFYENYCVFFFLGVRRQILEGGNGTLVLAAERTRRPDPLNHFNLYSDGWNVTNSHYIAVSPPFLNSPIFLFFFNFENVKLILICLRKHPL